MSLPTFSDQEAALFFKQDYHDQGMAKWQGFRLAEHVESVDRYMTSEAHQRDLHYQADMTPEQISDVLSQAWAQKKAVTLQLTIKNEEGLLNASLTGRVQGFTPENDLILSDKTIPLDTIHWCTLI